MKIKEIKEDMRELEVVGQITEIEEARQVYTKYGPARVATADAKIEKFVEELLAWSTDNLRDFEWRRASDPYRILVAELMLQRTGADQVATVYGKFLKKFPSPEHLAGSEITEIEKVVSSLGLRYRAGRLREIAIKLVKKYGGKVPPEREELISLPGVGNYVANAVMCLAFGRDAPLLDSNIARIVGRVFSLKTTQESHKSMKFWKVMEKMLPAGRAREFNLALVDLGSLICTPRNPRHEKCPLKDLCDFYHNPTVDENRLTR